MTNSNERLAPGTQVGDYYLQELVYEGPTTRTWSANQISVSREVMIDSLNRSMQTNEVVVDTFLSDIRTKAKVDHPLIGSVFEAVRKENICLYAREKLAGHHLEKMLHAGTKLPPEDVVHIIKQISESNLFLETHDVASLPLSPNQIYVSSTKMCRLINMAVGGPRDHNVSTADKHMIGTTFKDLLQRNAPGATRTRSLLDYMTDLDREIPLTWEQIRDLSEGVERQLTETREPTDLQSHTMKLQKKGISKQALAIIGSAFALLAVGLIIYLFLNREKPPEIRILKGEVSVPSGRYPNHDGITKQLNAFVIDSHEVTVAEYADFLKKMDQLDRSGQEPYQHDDHPSYKESHTPDDWDAMYAAAKKGETWNGLTITLNHPIVGVDWWDAYAYASFNGRRLPTQEEWFACIVASKTKPDELAVSPWGPVDQQAGDITKNQIFGLAGNVSEWTLKRTKPIHEPTAVKKLPVICGASYNSNLQGALKREWIKPRDIQDSRDTRRANLGFRTVAQPQ